MRRRRSLNRLELEPELLMPVETDVNWEVEALPEEIAEPDGAAPARRD